MCFLVFFSCSCLLFNTLHMYIISYMCIDVLPIFSGVHSYIYIYIYIIIYTLQILWPEEGAGGTDCAAQ